MGRLGAAVGTALTVLAVVAAVALANNPPQASFTYSPAAPKPGDQITFTSTSTDSDGTIARTSWDLDGNGTFETTGTTATHTFAAEGTYTVSLQVADNGGATDTTSRQVTVGNPPPPPPPPPPVPQPSGLITFEENPAGTQVHSQYANQGVQLGYTSDDATGKSGAFPTIVSDPAAHSDGQVAKTPLCGAEFCSNTIYGRFDSPRSHIEVYAGGGAKVALLGFTAQGALVSQDFKQTGAGTQTKLVLNQNKKRLLYFSIGEDAPIGNQFGTVKIDDLSFDAGDPSAGDFAISWTPQLPYQTIDVSPGGPPESTQIKLTRLNGFAGPVAFTVAGKPAGVSATITPNPVTNPASVATLKVSAASNAPGVNKANLTIHAKPAIGPDADPLLMHNVTIPMRVILSNYDVQVTGIEVNQAIQTAETPYYTDGGSLSPSICANYPSLPVRDPLSLSKPIPYETFTEEPLFPQSPVSELFGFDQSFNTVLRRHGGVELARDRKTVVRVFANLAGPPGHSIADVPAALSGKRGGKTLPGSPLSPDGGPLSIKSTGHPWVSCKDRGNPLGAYTFTLPKSWASGNVTLTAHVTPDKVLFGGGGECGSQTCDANNSLSLSQVNFTPTSYVAMTPLALALTDPATKSTILPPPPVKAFDYLRYITPSVLEYGAGANDQSYAAVLDVSDIAASGESNTQKCLDALNVVEDWADDHPHADATVGAFVGGSACAGGSDKCCHLATEQESFEVVDANRPRTSVAHEMFHGYGRAHASSACGATGKQAGDDWPPDQQGQTQGFGLDTRPGSGGLAPYRVLVPGLLGFKPAGPLNFFPEPDKWFDFMSYCAGEADAWVSERGWNDTLNTLYKFEKARGRTSKIRAAQAGMLRVSGVDDGASAHITLVRPGTGQPLAGDPSSGYRLIIRDGAGGVISDTPMRAEDNHVDGEGVATSLVAEAPAVGAASVEIVRAGAPIARRDRSSNAPRVTVTAPRARSRLGTGRSVLVSWQASDPDGGALRAMVDYSTDGGAQYAEIFAGPSSGRATLPSSLFTGSRRARVRVRVSDGFNESSAESGVFTAVDRRPTVTILSPLPGQKLLSSASAYLDGSAYDQQGRLLGGRRVQWFAGRKRLGGGLPLSIVNLPPGRRTIRLVARDSRGRTGSASVRVRVVGQAPRVLKLLAPVRLKRSARRLTFRIAVTAPGKLRVVRKSYPVGRRLRRISVGVRPGRSLLRLPMRISGAGKAHALTLAVERR